MEPIKKTPSFRLLTDEEALRWLIDVAQLPSERASRIVEGCRANVSHIEKPADERCHALGTAVNATRLISVAARIVLELRNAAPQDDQLARVRDRGSFPPDTELSVASLENLEYLAHAIGMPGTRHPFDGYTICVATTCAAGHPLIVDWRNGILTLDHKNFMAYGYGWAPKFAAYLLVVTDMPLS